MAEISDIRLMQWSAIPRGEKIKAQWHALHRRQIPHALLWVGPEGVGKTASAWAISQTLLCAENDSMTPCNSCQSCQLMMRLDHPNLILVPPLPSEMPLEEGVQLFRTYLQENPFLSLSEWEKALIEQRNKQSEQKSTSTGRSRLSLSISVEVVRRIQSILSLSNPTATWRIIWFWHAEMLTRQAANALLKVVEEPPARTIFIFLAKQLEILPITLRSRCQIWRFPPLSKEELESLSGEPIPALTYMLAQGSYARLRRLKDPSFEPYIRALQSWLRSLLHDNTDPAPFIEELVKSPQLSEILSMGAILIREHPNLTPLQKAIGMHTLLDMADAIEANLQPNLLLWEATLRLKELWRNPHFEWNWLAV